MRKYGSLIALAAAVGATIAFPAAAQDIAKTSPKPNSIEVEARLAAAFAKYDEGTKGYLTEAEFHTMMAEEQGGADEAKSQAVYAAADGNHNAELSLDEFIRFVTAQLKARAQPQPQDRAGGGRGRMVAQFDEMWKKYDTDAKGWLSEDEYVAMMAEVGEKVRAAQAEMGRSGGAGEWTAEDAERRARETFAQADSDKNGELTQAELKAHFAAQAGERRERRGEGRRGGADTGDVQGPDID